MEKYRQLQVLGKGSFGSAWLVQRIQDNAQFVAKEVKLATMKPPERESAKHEIEVLRGLSHPNITRYVDHFEHKGSLYIVMEYANGGDLYNKIKSRRGVRFSEKEILHYFSQICLALLHLHDKRILHRDLKSQNVFLTADGIVKLGDFGISTVLRSTYELKRTVCGTPYYFSPELCLNKPYNNKSDVWALGCILYELTTLTHAFDGNSMKALVQKILKGVYPPIHPSYSSDLAKLVSSMLKIDPQQRPNVQQIIQLPYVRSFLTNMEKDIQKAPLVEAEEKLKMQKEAQQRVAQQREAAAAQQQQQQQAAAAQQQQQQNAAEAKELARQQRLAQAQQAMEAQIREHEARLRVIRENQKQYAEDQAKRKVELEEKLREQRRLQDERAAKLAAVQKQREEEWERNMRQQQEEQRRRQELDQQQQQGPGGVGVVGGRNNGNAGGGGYDAADAARLYQEMRRAAQQNRARALEAGAGGGGGGGGSPFPLVSEAPPPRRPSPPAVGARQNQPSPHAVASSPIDRPSAGMRAAAAADDLEEARRQAYWQMRREAEENRRRIMGLEPLPISREPLRQYAPPAVAAASPVVVTPAAAAAVRAPAAVVSGNSPSRGAVASPTPRTTSPNNGASPQPSAAEIAPQKPPERAALHAVEDEDEDDEEAGYHRFLNGEAITESKPPLLARGDTREEQHSPSPPQQQGGVALGNDVVDAAELARVQSVIHQALLQTAAPPPPSSSPPSAPAAGTAAATNSPTSGVDFSDPDDNDPTRFVLDGQTLHLPNCTASDPLMARIESLRMLLEASLGEEPFLQAYRLMDSVNEMDDDVELKVQTLLAPEMHRYIPLISQLLVCEAFFNRQQ